MTTPDPVPGVNRRRFLRAAGATAGLVAVGSGRAAASHDDPEGNPFAGFGGTSCDVPRTSDEYLPFDTDGRYGGWGGHEYHVTKPGLRGGENPIVFVHGNTHDACDFADHATRYLDRGYGGDQLWSITFREPTSTHDEMARQLDSFVANIRAYTGAATVDVVSHSLGVTGVRAWMADLSEIEGIDLDQGSRYHLVDTFVGCAGANHGTYTCGPRCESGPGAAEPCNVISPGCADQRGEPNPLYDLNNPDETPCGDSIDYYTIRGNLDYFFVTDLDSPALDGATNVLLVGRAHNATRASDTAIQLIYEFVTDNPEPDPERPAPDVEASGQRRDDGSVFTAGQTNQVQLSVSADRPVLLRDRIPYFWDVLCEHSDDVVAVAPRPHRRVKEVYLSTHPDHEHAVSYLVEAPARSGEYQFGPAQVRPPQSAVWADVPDTSEENVVIGVQT